MHKTSESRCNLNLEVLSWLFILHGLKHAMFRSVAGVAQTESDYGCCCTGKTPILSKSCTGFYLIYIGIIHFVAKTTADYPCFRLCKLMSQLRTSRFKLHRLSEVLCTSFIIIPYLILKELQNYVPIRYEKIISSKNISQYTGDNSHALEHGYWAGVNSLIIILGKKTCSSMLLNMVYLCF